jgi:transposase-like protein
VPAGDSTALVSGDDWAAELVDRSEAVALTGDGGLLTDLMRHVLQRRLEVEMADHLGYERRAVEGRGSGNSRNGSYPKTVTTEIGKVEVMMPPDRPGGFEPVTVRKRFKPPADLLRFMAEASAFNLSALVR